MKPHACTLETSSPFFDDLFILSKTSCVFDVSGEDNLFLDLGELFISAVFVCSIPESSVVV